MRSIDGRVVSLPRSALALTAIVALLGVALLAEVSVLFHESLDEGMTLASQRSLDLPALTPFGTWPDASAVTADGRALFAPKIAAVPVAPPEPAPPKQPKEQLSLMAIVIGPGGKFALLRSEQSQTVQQVQEGGIVGGWTLAAVDDNRVTLEDGGQQAVLYLPDTAPANP
jgi:hypothetical protein